MRVRIVIAQLLFTAAMLGAPAPAPTPTPVKATYVTADFGAAYTMSLVAPKPRTFRVFIPVTSEKGVRFEDLSAKVSAVAKGAVYDPDVMKQFRAETRVPDGATPQLEITATDAQLKPSVYSVTVEIASKTAKAGTLPQRLTFQLTIQTGEIKPLSAQVIDRVLACVWRCTDAASPKLRVTETSNRTALTGVEAHQNEALIAAEGSTTVTASIRSKQPVSIDAGRVGDLELTIDNDGNLPLGKSSTVVAVTANELPAAVLVPYEVRVRLHPWLLLPAILLGVAVGFGLRILLKRFIDRGVAQENAYAVIERIKTFARNEHDPIFLKDVAAARVAVVEAFEGDAAAVTSAVSAARASLQKAREELTDRLKTLADAIRATHQITQTNADFPHAIAEALMFAEHELEAVEALYAGRNASDGLFELDNVKRHLADNVAAATADWSNDIRDALGNASTVGPLPAPYAKRLTDAVTKVEAALDSALKDRSSAETMLAGVHAANFEAQYGVAEGAIEPLADYGDRVADELEKNGANVDRVRNAAAALRTAVADDRMHLLTGPVAALRTLLDAMQQVTGMLASDEQRDAVKKLLAEGKYEEAAKSIAGTTSSALERARPELSPTAEREGPPSWKARSGPETPDVFVEEFSEPRAWLRWQLAIARALSSFSIAILLALAGFAFLYPGFDGTARGLLTAFFWGYASDFSAEAITQASKARA